MRILKLVKKIPQLQMIISGLIGGLSSIGYIMLLLMLVFYLFGIMGFYAFGANDPWHFGTLHDALLTLFRMCTCEDWTDIMYVSWRDDTVREIPGMPPPNHRRGTGPTTCCLGYSLVS